MFSEAIRFNDGSVSRPDGQPAWRFVDGLVAVVVSSSACLVSWTDPVARSVRDVTTKPTLPSRLKPRWKIFNQRFQILRLRNVTSTAVTIETTAPAAAPPLLLLLLLLLKEICAAAAAAAAPAPAAAAPAAPSAGLSSHINSNIQVIHEQALG